MTTAPGHRDDELAEKFLDRFTDELSEAVLDEVIDNLADELPPQIVQELKGADLEPLTPREGIDQFLERKSGSVAPNTLDQHDTKLRYLFEYLRDELGLENLNELTPRDAEAYMQWRRDESLDRDEPLKLKTLKDDMHLYKQFLEYMVQLRAVSVDVYEIIEIPVLDEGDGVERETLDADRAGDILSYLDRFEFASTEHIVHLLLMKTGRRPCDLHALDVDDFDDSGGEPTLRFVHRPETGTELKAGVAHEAAVTLSERVGEIVRAYVDHNRPDVTDGAGREPLLATVHGRISKSTIREYAYKWTRPCQIGADCPHGRAIEDCEAARSTKDASKCPDSRSPRTIRSGYITSKLNAGASYEAVGHRVGATTDVLKKHYDHPDEDDERERYRDEIMGSNQGPRSGFSNNDEASEN